MDVFHHVAERIVHHPVAVEQTDTLERRANEDEIKLQWHRFSYALTMRERAVVDQCRSGRSVSGRTLAPQPPESSRSSCGMTEAAWL